MLNLSTKKLQQDKLCPYWKMEVSIFRWIAGFRLAWYRFKPKPCVLDLDMNSNAKTQQSGYLYNRISNYSLSSPRGASPRQIFQGYLDILYIFIKQDLQDVWMSGFPEIGISEQQDTLISAHSKAEVTNIKCARFAVRPRSAKGRTQRARLVPCHTVQHSY